MFFKEKGFYISLICGVVALVAFGAICMNLAGSDSGEQQVAEATKAPEVTSTPVVTATPEAQETGNNTAAEKKEKKKAKRTPEPETVETDVQPIQNTLHFDQETGLLWPLEGEVLMEYSADKVVYFETLAQYRTNPALLISAKEDTVVKAAAQGIVTEITTSEETGRTLIMDIGDDFSVSYGQLKEITVQSGDLVTEGQVIGKIAEPTKYYSLEGANLYFQVKEKDTTVNPMLLLR